MSGSEAARRRIMRGAYACCKDGKKSCDKPQRQNGEASSRQQPKMQKRLAGPAQDAAAYFRLCGADMQLRSDLAASHCIHMSKQLRDGTPGCCSLQPRRAGRLSRSVAASKGENQLRALVGQRGEGARAHWFNEMQVGNATAFSIFPSFVFLLKTLASSLRRPAARRAQLDGSRSSKRASRTPASCN